MTNMVDAAGTTILVTPLAGSCTPKTRLRQGYGEAGGPWSNDTVTNSYNNRLRTGLSLAQPTGKWTNGFAYDAAKRLTNVTSPAGAFDYYLGATAAASPLVKKLALPNTSYITNAYDNVARLLFTKLNNSSHTTLDSALYGYDAGNQRTTFTNAAGTYVQYTNDPIGQLKIANSSVNSEDRGYTYDAAWNLNYRTNNTTLQTFKVDGKNQLTNAIGSTCQYDANGNLRSNLTTSIDYTYDDENQLVMFEQAYGLRSVFTYDGRGRLRQRVDYQWAGTPYNQWFLGTTLRYIYDGMRVIQERDSSNVPTVSYTRGTDLSGSLEGAGGIGGLLSRSQGYSSGTGNWSVHHSYHADGNGNITYLVNSSQTLGASYRYDPYGNTISSSGGLASANTYRFSSKEIHADSGLYYYGYRFYAPNLQRWLNRDPIEEKGGINLYTFVRNNPSNLLDPLGLDESECQRRKAFWDTVKCQAWCDEAVKLCNKMVKNKARELCYACCDSAGEDKVGGKACIAATAAGCVGGRAVPSK